MKINEFGTKKKKKKSHVKMNWVKIACVYK